MSFAEVGKDKFNHYVIIGTNNESLAVLARFLITAISSNLSLDYYMNWLSGYYEQNWASGNAYELLRENEDIVIYSMYSFDDDDEDENYKTLPSNMYFKISCEKLKDIIIKWALLVSQKNRPERITIIQDEKQNVNITPHV